MRIAYRLLAAWSLVATVQLMSDTHHGAWHTVAGIFAWLFAWLTIVFTLAAARADRRASELTAARSEAAQAMSDGKARTAAGWQAVVNDLPTHDREE